MFDVTNYSIYGIPLFTYGMIGITTVVLATLTIYESMDSTNESILSNLPSVIPEETSSETSSEEEVSEEEEEEEESDNQNSPSTIMNKGGKKTKKHFKNKNKKNKKNKTSRKK